MYIFKNSFRNTVRNKGRTILTGIIIVVIAFSSCVALSIRQAAQTAKEEALEGLSITAQISLDRSSMMKENSQSSDSSYHAYSRIRANSFLHRALVRC